MARQFVILLALAVAAVACAQAAVTGEHYDTCMWGGFEVEQSESVISANALGMCKRCRCVAAEMVCDEEEQPCDPITVAAAVEPLPAVAATERKMRTIRSPKTKLTCEEKKCVTACIMENGVPRCL